MDQDDSVGQNTHEAMFRSANEIFLHFKTSPKGLTHADALTRLKKDGPNVVRDTREVGIIREFLSHFANPLIIILLVAAGISAWLGEVKNLIIIAVMVLISVLLDFFEEHSANTAVKGLKERVTTTAVVVRDGKETCIPASQVCVGDLIVLSAGDLVPADAHIVVADDFFINQSALTGESFPVEKFAVTAEQTVDAQETRNTQIFLGSSVISGSAKAIVCATGPRTMYGHIAERVLGRDTKSEFEIGITHFGYFIAKVTLVLVMLIFLGNALMHHDVLESFIFAIAIAVGMTPELLPIIMSVTMAQGAKRMARVGVIVKKLSAIPNFGSMDILCTDKTGTLTKDEIALVQYTDCEGRENESVLRYAYLNSIHQTGVRNPLDKAVIVFRDIDVHAYIKTEEIPFDFARKMMSVAVAGPESRVLITKGAPEAVLNHCVRYMKRGRRYSLTGHARTVIEAEYERLSKEGHRVLAVAVKYDLPNQKQYTTHDESDLIFLGFVSFLDPPKEDVRDVLRALQSYGVGVKIITGDNEWVTEKICRDIGMEVHGVLSGEDLSVLADDALGVRAEATTLFVRCSPDQKNRIITALRSRGHVVGYLGDGINDAPSLKAADIGISVDNAVDVAQETADIILTRKHLQPIIDGIVEGRISFGNTVKYIMMGLSSNFGNMFSVLGALVYLPFLPMLPVQLLLNNFLYDSSQVAISTDRVDADWVKRPRKWNLNQLKKFMYVFGPVSSLFDFCTFFILFGIFQLNASSFQTGWFMESLATQVLVVHVVRTRALPFFGSRASRLLTGMTLGVVAIGWMIPYTPLGTAFGFVPLPISVLLTIAGLVLAYLCLVEVIKRIYYRYGAHDVVFE